MKTPKHLTRLNISNETPYLVLFTEKHGDCHYLARSAKEVCKACLEMFNIRYKSNRYYFEPELRLPDEPGLTPEQVSALPDGKIKEEALKQIKRWNRAKTCYQNELVAWNEIQAVYEEQDAAGAFLILFNRSDYEYENMELIKLSIPE